MSIDLPNLTQLNAAAELVHRVVPPTPQYCWPLLSQRVGAELWVKHENQTQTGAFKLRGGLAYLDDLKPEGDNRRAAWQQPGEKPGDASLRRDAD